MIALWIVGGILVVAVTVVIILMVQSIKSKVDKVDTKLPDLDDGTNDEEVEVMQDMLEYDVDSLLVEGIDEQEDTNQIILDDKKLDSSNNKSQSLPLLEKSASNAFDDMCGSLSPDEISREIEY